jgi:hypothetical protein
MSIRVRDAFRAGDAMCSTQITSSRSWRAVVVAEIFPTPFKPSVGCLKYRRKSVRFEYTQGKKDTRPKGMHAVDEKRNWSKASQEGQETRNLKAMARSLREERIEW